MNASLPGLDSASLHFVTGATGFVGRALVARLLATGAHVRALVLPDDPHRPLLERLSNGRSLEILVGDVCDAHALSPLLDGVDYVFHTAALVHAWAPYDRFHRVNVGGTRNIAELALAHGVRRLVSLSTSDVFGMPVGDEVFDESSPLRPWGEPYPDTKIEAERWLWRLHRESGLPLSVIYPGWVYGPGDLAFFPGLAHAIGQGQMMFWFHGAKLPFVYIDNLVDACCLAAVAPQANGQGYIVHDDTDGPTLEELCADIARAIDARPPTRHIPYGLALRAARLLQTLWRWRRATTPPPLLSVDVKAFGMQYRLSTAKVRRDLGWQPRVGREEGMRHALDDLQRLLHS